MENSTNTDKLLDMNIWEVVGLNLTPEEQDEYNAQFEREAWLTLIDEKLPKIVGKGNYDVICKSFIDKEISEEEFAEKVKDIYITNELNFEDDFDNCMEEVMKVFVEDQMDFLERRVKGVKDATEREVKLSLIKTLRDLLSTNQWSQMGQIFKKIDAYQLDQGLVLHL